MLSTVYRIIRLDLLFSLQQMMLKDKKQIIKKKKNRLTIKVAKPEVHSHFFFSLPGWVIDSRNLN